MSLNFFLKKHTHIPPHSTVQCMNMNISAYMVAKLYIKPDPHCCQVFFWLLLNNGGLLLRPPLLSKVLESLGEWYIHTTHHHPKRQH